MTEHPDWVREAVNQMEPGIVDLDSEQSAESLTVAAAISTAISTKRMADLLAEVADTSRWDGAPYLRARPR